MKLKKITEDRILQISNDIAEGMGKYTKHELAQVVLYWMNQNSKSIADHNRYRDNLIVKIAQLSADSMKMK